MKERKCLKTFTTPANPVSLPPLERLRSACGTGVFDSDWIILVEGRADVINLLRAGL